MTDYFYSITSSQLRILVLANKLEIEFDEDGFAISHFEVDETADIWSISLYPNDVDDKTFRERIMGCVAPLLPDEVLSREKLPEVDWVLKSLDSLQPVEAGGFVVHGNHNKDTINRALTPIEINAGLAFGTGHHGTTAGCLDILSKYVSQWDLASVLDIGTGSGVLAIALAKLLPCTVHASDLDPMSITVTLGNAAINDVANQLIVFEASGCDHRIIRDHGAFDLIVANILAGPLIELAPSISATCKKEGHIILSGLLVDQGENVIAAYVDCNCTLVEQYQRDGWLTLVLQNR